MRRLIITALFALAAAVSSVAAQQNIATLRGTTPLTEGASPPPMAKVVDEGVRQQRSYPEQAPTIPHSIRDYQVDLNVNKCLACHARKRTEESQAPMVSITHFMDRDGQFLATVSPRRYFCSQCHVVEHKVKPLVENEFVDIDTLLGNE